MQYNLQRFITAHNEHFERALAEITSGRKRSHWIWYIFPQLKGLGFSETAQYYGLESVGEAQAFLEHPQLGQNLITISSRLLNIEADNATSIFGTPDDLKLRSSMTLFSMADPANPLFLDVLNKFFDGKKDDKTILLLNR